MKTTILILALICLGGVAARTAGNACSPGLLAAQYKYENSICLSCPIGCLECGTDGKCTSCVEGSTLTEGGSCAISDLTCADPFCEINGTYACGKCSPGYRAALKDTVATAYCTNCTQGNCLTCTVDECTGCMAGFFLVDKACTACGSNCAACTAADACTTCKGGFFLNAGACTACGTGCDTCTAADNCSVCNYSYVLNTTSNGCVANDGCEEGDGTDKCKTCADGYRLADGKCVKCTGSAATCDTAGNA